MTGARTDAGAARDLARVLVREAREGEAGLLSELTYRSKAHWGYDAEFMRDARADLTLTPDYVRANAVFVLEEGGAVVGYYSLREIGGVLELENLFVAPEQIGAGHGETLFRHAAAEARRLGHARFVIRSDPSAEGFYLRMGARRIGEAASSMRPGRALPLLAYTHG